MGETVMRNMGRLSVGDATAEMVATIDFDKLRDLAVKAIKNKSGEARVLHGAVRVRAVNRTARNVESEVSNG